MGTRRTNSDGYVLIKLPDGSWTGEHRALMAEWLNRPLVQNETVHHKNGERSDNSRGNLELWYRSQPGGQRIPDLIDYLATYHRTALEEALQRRVGA